MSLDNTLGEMPLSSPKKVKPLIVRAFEWCLWQTRFLVLLGVLSGLLASLALFTIGTLDVLHVLKQVWGYYFLHMAEIDIHGAVIGELIGAVDIFLIAVVLLIFSFGLYELFISDLEPAQQSNVSSSLQIKSLESLKDKLAQVIVMALIVKFFQVVLNTHFSTILDMVYLAVSISVLVLSLFFLYRSKKQDAK